MSCALLAALGPTSRLRQHRKSLEVTMALNTKGLERRQQRSFHMGPRRSLRAPPATATASATSSDCGGRCFVRWSSGSKLRGDLGVVQTPAPGLPYTLVRAAKDSMAVLSRDAGSCSDACNRSE